MAPRSAGPAHQEWRAWPGQLVGVAFILAGAGVALFGLHLLAEGIGGSSGDPPFIREMGLMILLTTIPLLIITPGLLGIALGWGLVTLRGWAWVSAVSVIGFVALVVTGAYVTGIREALPALVVTGLLLALLLEPGTRARYRASPV